MSNITNRLYVPIMSCTCFRVNLHSVVACMSSNSLMKTGLKVSLSLIFAAKLNCKYSDMVLA